MASRKPSLLLSLPLRREPCGIGMGPPGEPRGECIATFVDEDAAALVEIARAAEEGEEGAAFVEVATDEDAAVAAA